jgi:predicted outer membrane repeat protein
MEKNLFNENESKTKGGGIYFSCPTEKCFLKLDSTSFSNNKAAEGAAIAYEHIEPNFEDSVLFTNNQVIKPFKHKALNKYEFEL